MYLSIYRAYARTTSHLKKKMLFYRYKYVFFPKYKKQKKKKQVISWGVIISHFLSYAVILAYVGYVYINIYYSNKIIVLFN